jgi:hypothetical protein
MAAPVAAQPTFESRVSAPHRWQTELAVLVWFQLKRLHDGLQIDAPIHMWESALTSQVVGREPLLPLHPGSKSIGVDLQKHKPSLTLVEPAGDRRQLTGRGAVDEAFVIQARRHIRAMAFGVEPGLPGRNVIEPHGRTS